jgi:HEPN domain-containing protein
LYAIERIAKQTKKIQSWKFFDYIGKIAFGFFLFILSSPIILIAILGIYAITRTAITLTPKQQQFVYAIMSLFSWFAGATLTFLLTGYIISSLKRRRNESISEAEANVLYGALRLMENGFYSQAIFEATNALEWHLIHIISEKDISLPKKHFSLIQLADHAAKLRLLSGSEVALVKRISALRNKLAHAKSRYKEDALHVIDNVKTIINKTKT